MARQISTSQPNQIASAPATVEACQADREGRNPALQAAEASVQNGLAKANAHATGAPTRRT